jgi:anti-anti-sigma factor
MPRDGAAMLPCLSDHEPRFRRGTALTSTILPGQPGRVRIAFEGEIDLTSVARLISPVQRAVRPPAPGHLDVDLDQVTFVDCTGITALMKCQASASAAGCHLMVVNPRPLVQRVLGLTNTLEALCGVSSSLGT